MIPGKTTLIGALCLAASGVGADTAADGNGGPRKPEPGGELRLTIERLPSEEGQVIVALFDASEHYRENEKPFRHAILPAAEGPALEHVFRGLPGGRYAVKLFHDANGNHDLDTNWIGLPKEAYGFSRNPEIRFGAPSFDRAAFEVADGTRSLRIELNH